MKENTMNDLLKEIMTDTNILIDIKIDKIDIKKDMSKETIKDHFKEKEKFHMRGIIIFLKI